MDLDINSFADIPKLSLIKASLAASLTTLAVGSIALAIFCSMAAPAPTLLVIGVVSLVIGIGLAVLCAYIALKHFSNDKIPSPLKTPLLPPSSNKLPRNGGTAPSYTKVNPTTKSTSSIVQQNQAIIQKMAAKVNYIDNYYDQLLRAGVREQYLAKEAKEIENFVSDFEAYFLQQFESFDGLYCPLFFLFIQVFDVQDEQIRIKIAKICAQNDNSMTAKHIQNFGINDQQALIKIAKICAQNDDSVTAEHIQKFGIKDQQALIKIAKICAQNDDSVTAEHIQKFGINDQQALIEIAEICAQKCRFTAEYIENFGIKDQKDLIEIAEICAQNVNSMTAKHIQNFGIKDQQALIKIAKICAQNDVFTTMYIQNFGINDQQALIEIAEICAQKCRFTAEHIQNFGIKDQQALIKIAEICAQNRDSMTAKHIQNFGINNQQVLIEIAKICAQNSVFTAKYIQNFGINDQQVLIEIAKICAQNDDSRTAGHIQKFGINNQQVLIEIAKICAQKSKFTYQNIENFKLNDEETFSIFLICLKNDKDIFYKVPKEKIPNHLTLDGLGALAKVEIILEKKITNCSKELIKFLASLETSIKNGCRFDCEKTIRDLLIPALFLVEHELSQTQKEKFLQSDFLSLILQLPCNDNSKWKLIVQGIEGAKTDYFLEEMEKYLAPISMEPIPGKSDEENKKILEAKKNHKAAVLELIIPALSMAGNELSKSQREKFLESPLLQSILDLRRPDLKWRLIVTAIEGMKKDIPLQKGNGKKAGGHQILTMLLAISCFEGYDDGAAKQIAAFSENALYKDGRQQHQLIEALLLITENSQLDVLAKRRLLTKLVDVPPEKTPLTPQAIEKLIPEKEKLSSADLKKQKKDLRSQDQENIRKHNENRIYIFSSKVSQLLALLAAENYEICKADDSRTLDELLESVFKELLPLDKIENFGEAFSKTFGASRTPLAVMIYAAKLKTLKDDNVLKDLAIYVKAVMEGKYIDLRHSLESNPHLQQIEKRDSEILQKWFVEEPSFALSEIDKTETTEALDYRRWLHQKLISDNHIPSLENKAPELHRYLINSSDTSTVDVVTKASALIEAKEESEIIVALEQLAVLPFVKGTQFEQDLKDQINSLRRKNFGNNEQMVVIDTEDPIDILNAGAEVQGSCQNYAGQPQFNKGLLGYLLDGKIRMIAIKSKNGPEGKIIGRALLKLLWDGEKPVLFLERFYLNQNSATHEKAIKEMALRKAKTMGLDLVSLNGKGTSYPKNLTSLGGPASFEYSDGSRGVMNKGKYSIRSALFHN